MSVRADAPELAARAMREAGEPEASIRAFTRRVEALAAGATGLLPDAELEPVAEVPPLDALPDAADSPLDALAVVRLNGGLGTSMGLHGPKSLIEAKEGRTFLDLIVEQTLAQRARYGARLPVVLMDSFRTREPSLAALARQPEIGADVPPDFLQGRVPKLRADDLTPVSWPADPGLEWAPPGHGDLYPALFGSGMLDTLLEHGYEYAFVANVDNLGAVLEPRVLAWMAAERAPFVMEVVRGTAADRKGGHIARRAGRLVLRETAQVPEEDADSFSDVERWRWYNTNNLWMHLPSVRDAMAGDGIALPLIVNPKHVDPTDPDSPEVVQLESAMGAALGALRGARAVHVERTRFAPVKTTADLLAVRSDAYALRADGRVELATESGSPPDVVLDKEVYGHLEPFEARFPAGPPSLVRCEALRVEGDVSFGTDVVVHGSVTVRGPQRVPDGAVLEG